MLRTYVHFDLLLIIYQHGLLLVRHVPKFDRGDFWRTLMVELEYCKLDHVVLGIMLLAIIKMIYTICRDRNMKLQAINTSQLEQVERFAIDN